MEYYVMNIIHGCWEFQNDLTFIYEDMGPFTRNMGVFKKSWKVHQNQWQISYDHSLSYFFLSSATGIISLIDFHFRLERCRMAQPKYVYTKPGQDGH